MKTFLTSLLFAATLSAHAGVNCPRPFGRYYVIPKIEKAHTFSGEAHAEGLNPSSMNVLVWNIKKALMPNWQSEFEEYSHGRDILLIQEANTTKRFKSTLDALTGYRFDLGISFFYKIYGNQATGNMIGANVTPSGVVVKHTPDYEPGVQTPKTTIFAKYPIKGSTESLLVISVHGINLTSYLSFVRNMLQVEAEITSHSGPVVFAGDFNTRTFARTAYMTLMMKRLNFDTVSFKNGERRMKFKFTPYYLDHAFTRGLVVKNAEVIGDSSGSDHKPMTLELALAE